MKWITISLIIFFSANNIALSQSYHPWQKQNRYKQITNEDIFPFKIPQGNLKDYGAILSKMGFEDKNLVVSEYELLSFTDSLIKGDEKIEMPISWGSLYPLVKNIKSNNPINLSIINSKEVSFITVSNFEVEAPLGYESYSICSDIQEICPLKINMLIKNTDKIEMFIFTKCKPTDSSVTKKDSTVYQNGNIIKYEFWQVDLYDDKYIDAFKFKRSILDKEANEGNLSNNEETIIIGTFIDGKWLKTSSHTSNDEYSIGY